MEKELSPEKLAEVKNIGKTGQVHGIGGGANVAESPTVQSTPKASAGDNTTGGIEQGYTPTYKPSITPRVPQNKPKTKGRSR